MTYDDIEATDRIRDTWARLIKSSYPKLHEYIMRAKYEYPYRSSVDRWNGDPDFYLGRVIAWAEDQL